MDVASSNRATSGDGAEETGARAGLVGHGLYYGVLALIVGRLAFGGGKEGEAGPQGALATLAEQPFGRVLLVLATVGFAAYAFRGWRIVADGSEDTSDRVEKALSATWWSAVAVFAASWWLTGGSGGGGGQDSTGMTARVLELPGGQLLVGAVGIGFLVAAARQVQRALEGALDDELHELGLDERRSARLLGRAGYAGRALVFGLIGVFVTHAAVTHDPEAGKGLDGALAEVQQSSFGTPVLLAVALGLAAFAVFRLVEARYASDPT